MLFISTVTPPTYHCAQLTICDYQNRMKSEDIIISTISPPIHKLTGYDFQKDIKDDDQIIGITTCKHAQLTNYDLGCKIISIIIPQKCYNLNTQLTSYDC